jgi:transposase
MNELSVTEQERIAGLLRLGWSKRRISRETGHRRETITRYGIAAGLLPAQAKPSTHKVPPGQDPESGPIPPGDGPSEPIGELPAGSAGEPPAVRRPAQVTTRSRCEPHREFIAGEVAKGRPSVAIYEDMVEHLGYEGALDSVKRFVRSLRADDPKVFCRFETEPGQEAQVDYGEGAPTRHPRTGRYAIPDLFIFTLGFSRYGYQEVVWNQSQQTWCELHERAFAYIGGVTKVIRQDNLKAAVIKADVYDPELNELYAGTMAHYDTIVFPCRPYAPNLKGKVESAVGYVQGRLKGLKFESLEEQNAYLWQRNERWWSTRIHGTTKRQVREMFDEERPHLLPLPLTRFEYYRVLERRVHPDGHIEVGRAYYSAPLRYVGCMVVVHLGRLWLRILDPTSRTCLREHEVTQPGRRRTVAADLPKQTPPAVDRIVAKIERIGPSCGAFARAVVAERGVVALRTLFGVLDLARRHDAAEIERACQLAVQSGTSRLRLLRLLLAGRQTVPPLTDQHPIIPGIDKYVDHFATMTNGEPHHDL